MYKEPSHEKCQTLCTPHQQTALLSNAVDILNFHPTWLVPLDMIQSKLVLDFSWEVMWLLFPLPPVQRRSSYEVILSKGHRNKRSWRLLPSSMERDMSQDFGLDCHRHFQLLAIEDLKQWWAPWSTTSSPQSTSFAGMHNYRYVYIYWSLNSTLTNLPFQIRD